MNSKQDHLTEVTGQGRTGVVLSTPGPWGADCYADGGYQIFAEGRGHSGGLLVIASRNQYTVRSAEMHANAYLIAAAPVLFECLSQIVAQYEAAPDGPLGKGFTNGPFLAARAAIAAVQAPSALARESETECQELTEVSLTEEDLRAIDTAYEAHKRADCASYGQLSADKASDYERDMRSGGWKP